MLTKLAFSRKPLGDAVEVKDALTLMISFAGLMLALLTLVIRVIEVFHRNKK
ncbi:putative holin-like toxin [Paenibacillus sp. YN15]|uniref:putative holin-like toxin n=1 Tax=Paenibacillus sp. YN15 TaxID=1742774 RepID=UPI0015ECCA8A|nr:putative holin-like toxin [Paenibacillus sp. YN15]